MLTTFLSTLEQMGRIFIVIACGYALHKTHAVPKAAESVVSKLVTLLFAPALSFYSFLEECQISTLLAFGHLVLIGIVFRVVSVGSSYPMAKLFVPKDDYKRGVYRYSLAIANGGAFGTPLMLAFYGTPGLFQFNLFQISATFMTYTWGAAQMQPSHKKTTFLKGLLDCLNPNTIAMFAGMLLGILGAKAWMPNIVMTTFKDLGTCYVIGGLLVIGFTLADYPIKNIFKNFKVYIYALLRLIVIPGILLIALFLLDASEILCTMTVLAYAAPCGMGAVIFPAFYGVECEDGAQMVLITSLASIFTIPVMCGIVSLFAG